MVRLNAELHQSSSAFVKIFHLEPLASSSLFPSIPELVHLFHHDQFPGNANKLMNKNYYMKVTEK